VNFFTTFNPPHLIDVYFLLQNSFIFLLDNFYKSCPFNYSLSLAGVFFISRRVQRWRDLASAIGGINWKRIRTAAALKVHEIRMKSARVCTILLSDMYARYCVLTSRKNIVSIGARVRSAWKEAQNFSKNNAHSMTSRPPSLRLDVCAV
jgi:hypothetical protein